MLEAYRKHAAERAEQGIVPKPLSAEQVAGLVELLKSPPAGEEEFLMDLLSNRVPAGVDEAAYVKAGFLSAVAKGEAKSPLIDQPLAVKLLGTMFGGYNISTLVELLDSDTLAVAAADELCHTLLMFDAYHDVAAKAAAEDERKVKPPAAVARRVAAMAALAKYNRVGSYGVRGESPGTAITGGGGQTTPKAVDESSGTDSSGASGSEETSDSD